jgi:UDP-MurNAc hydroxylase
MHIEWVNHASFIFRDGEASLITDPWISGPAFNNGWELLSLSKISPQDFAGITHIWFSHEHPDHFSPPNLREIPEALRKSITVLYHETRDKRVIKLCKGLGFQTREMPEGEATAISSRTQLTVGPNDLIDSWLAIRSGGKLLLNLNDCVFNDSAELAKIHRKQGDAFVLLTQFSYANWVGNPEDIASHRRHAERKREQIRRQVEIFRPQHLIPFASYVIFAHEENFCFNREINQITDIFRFTSEKLGVPTVVLYPGDTWEIGAVHDSSAALTKYAADYQAALARGPVNRSKSVTLDQLRAASETYLRKIYAKNRKLVLQMAIPPAAVYLRDLGISVNVSVQNGIQAVDTPMEKTDIILSADSLQYCYSFDWGGDTLAVNGRYEVPPGGNPERFFWNFRPAMYNASGHSIGYRFLLTQAAKRVRRKLQFST